MREILFRGKQTDNGEWCEGFYSAEEYNLNTHSIEYIPRIQLLGKCVSLGVIPETVGQFTGLYDKNGKKIFEGDIIGTDIARPYLIVEFRDGCFMFNCNDGGKDYYDIMLPILKEAQTEYKYGEVIGNIHDNPELLEGGEQNGENHICKRP